MTGSPGRPDELAQLRARIEELEAESKQQRTAIELHSMLVDLERANRDLRRLADGLRQALRDQRKGQLERLSEVERKLSRALETREEAERERDNAIRRLDQVYSSFTWKLGRLAKKMIDPLLAMRRMLMRRSKRTLASFESAANSSVTDLSSIEAMQAADLDMAEDLTVKAAYEAAIQRRSFSAGSHRRVAMAVSTLDFNQGRGDLYVAVGLGRYLERFGYEVVYLPPSQWYEAPSDTDIYLALLSAVDPARIPKGPFKIAWARNETAVWASNPTLNLYDLLLASSIRSLEYLKEVYAGPSRILPIGVDLELFHPGDEQQRSAVVTTVNQWGRERDVYAALRSCPIAFPLAIFGQTRGLAADLIPYSQGPASFFALPGIYRQAAVVLDDFNHTTIDYGNVNSRIFESIAAGAVPITNTRLGLGELGLGSVPAYETSTEMHDLVVELCNDDVVRTKLVSDLSEIVRREHSFERRAQQLHEMLEDGSDLYPSRTMVAFFPDYRVTNPYQAILYRSLTPEFVPVPIQDIMEMKELESPHAADGILHIHWTAPILGPAEDTSQALARLDLFTAQLERAKRSGIRILWTVHNVLPHESRFLDLERVLRQELADRADIVHVMCDRTVDEIGDRYVIPEGKVRLVPHGSYVGVYPDVVAPEVARERLGYAADDTVILFLGGIRPYKGVDLLIDAFEKAVVSEPSLKLLIVGRPGKFPGLRDLERRATSHPLIEANFNEIADVDLQHFFKAADVVVLPYRTILNSGSAQLAFSFARPVIAPRLACLPDVESEGLGLAFEPEDVDGLADCLVNSVSLKSREYQQQAKRYADEYTGNDMSRDFVTLLRELQGADRLQ